MSQNQIPLLTKILPLFGLLLVVPLLSSHATLDPGLLIRFLGLQLILALLLVQWVVNKQFKLRGLKSSLWIVWLLFAVYTVIRLLWGNSYSDSFFEWMKILSYQLLLFLLIQNYSFKELQKGIAWSLSILGVILAIWGLVELVEVMQSGKLNIPLSTYQVKTVFGHRNLFLQILFLTLPFQLYLAVTEKSKTFSALIVTFSSLSLFLLIVLSNRTIWLSLVVIILLFTGFVLWKKRQKPTFLLILNKPFRWIGITFSATLLFSVLFFALFTVTDEAGSHAGNILKLDNGSGKDRIELWKRTLQIIEENPAFGCGAANWKIEMLKYGNKGLVSENNVTFYQRPHNDFLWIASEYGLFGGIIYILGFLLAFYLALSQIKNQQETRRQLFFLSVLFALTGFTLFSFFSFPHERIVSNILLFTLFALLISGNAETKIETTGSKNRKLPWMSFLLLALMIVGSFYFGYQRYTAESHTKGALEAKMDNQQKRVIEEIEQAESAYYQMDPLSTPLSWYAGLAWYQLGKPDSAIRCFKKAMALNP
ncbi:MAG: O-antigen ligase family protein, partial [Bacteroidales bacterium]